jgi:hypothetical protein
MSFTHSQKKIALNDHTVKIVKTFESATCVNDYEKNMQRLFMLRVIADNPELMRCGIDNFEIMKMCFKDGKWVIDLEAIG